VVRMLEAEVLVVRMFAVLQRGRGSSGSDVCCTTERPRF
jgi:hypothetical protein